MFIIVLKSRLKYWDFFYWRIFVPREMYSMSIAHSVHLRFGKPVRSHEDLRQLCDDAKNAKIVLTQLKMMNEVGPLSVLSDIVSRLQPYLQRRWQKRALELNDSKDAYPEFSDLCDFLSAASKHSSDPVYGYSYMKKR